MIKGKNFEINAKNIRGHEIIGLGVEVIFCSDAGRVGICGKVVDESKKTITIRGTHRQKSGGVTIKKFVLPKNECIFEFDLNGEKEIVDGKEILKRSEDRTKEWRN